MTRDGRIRSGGDLHEVEALAVRELEGFLRLEDSDLPPVLVHEANALRADLLVDALVPLARNLPVEVGPAAAWSQRPFIKLPASSL